MNAGLYEQRNALPHTNSSLCHHCFNTPVSSPRQISHPLLAIAWGSNLVTAHFVSRSRLSLRPPLPFLPWVSEKKPFRLGANGSCFSKEKTHVFKTLTTSARQELLCFWSTAALFKLLTASAGTGIISLYRSPLFLSVLLCDNLHHMGGLTARAN